MTEDQKGPREREFKHVIPLRDRSEAEMEEEFRRSLTPEQLARMEADKERARQAVEGARAASASVREAAALGASGRFPGGPVDPVDSSALEAALAGLIEAVADAQQRLAVQRRQSGVDADILDQLGPRAGRTVARDEGVQRASGVFVRRLVDLIEQRRR